MRGGAPQERLTAARRNAGVPVRTLGHSRYAEYQTTSYRPDQRLSNWHPHPYRLVTDGGLRHAGTVVSWPRHDTTRLTEEFRRAVRRLRVRFITSLGVGAHFEAWDIPVERITELEWWETITLEASGVSMAATPSQHFSGRTLLDRQRPHGRRFTSRGRYTRCFTAPTRR